MKNERLLSQRARARFSPAGPRRILVAMDEQAHGTVSRAALLARSLDARLEVMTVRKTRMGLRTAATVTHADIIDRHAIASLCDCGSKLPPALGKGQIILGSPAHAISVRALDSDADLVVVNRARRRWGMPVLDRRADAELLRRCRQPLLFVGAESCAAYTRVLVAMDFSEAATYAARIAATIAPYAQFTFVHAVRLADEDLMHELQLPRELVGRFRKKACAAGREKLGHLVASLGLDQRRIAIVAEHGAAEHVIAACSRRMQADLVVLGTHPQPWLLDLVAGSTALHLLRTSPVDLLIAAAHCPDTADAQ